MAATLKSRVALHAGTTARYGSEKFQDWEVDGVLLQGIPKEKANGYFQQAWDAAKLVETGGQYELHRANADKEANYAEVWEKADSNKESIWLRKFDFNMSVHSYNSMMCPPRMASEGGDRFNPTLDWVELFDGLPLDDNGHFSAFEEELRLLSAAPSSTVIFLNASTAGSYSSFIIPARKSNFMPPL